MRQYTVKNLLQLIKHYASVAVDLSLYTLASGDKTVAVETLKIERKVDEYVKELIAKISLAVRSPEQTHLAVSVAEVGRALDKITDAAGDLAGLVLRGYPIHEYISSVVNCCDEIILLLHVNKPVKEFSPIVDLLIVKRGESYLVAPELTSVEEGDILVARGPHEEIADLAKEVGDTHSLKTLGLGSLSAALAGDDLALRILRIKNLARQMLDLAFHSLIYGDPRIAGLIREMEDSVDTLFHEILEYSYVASNPGYAKEFVSIAIFASAMETIADAAVQMSEIVRREGYLPFIGKALEEAEEAYLKIRATDKVSGKRLLDLSLPDRGVIVIALEKKGSWIIPVSPDYTIEEGDVLLVKYFKPEGEESEEKIEKILEDLGFEILED
ncbi:MAG: hypothetical protein GSR81_05870 [Desulfurococcales archaeon]|nr:hypothetical protein [Desulfurococcales archaeon]